MMTARFLSGASLFALLIVDICCLPVKKGFNPSASHINSNAAATAGVQREPAGHLGSSSSSSGPALFGHWGHAAGAGVGAGAGAGAGAALYGGTGAAPHSGAGAALYAGTGAAPHSGAGAALYAGTGAAPHSGAALYAGTGAAPHLYSRDMNWAVAPLSTFSVGEGRSAGASGVGSSGPVNVSPAIYPPPPAYQAGEMSNLEEAFEHGNYETETEDQGFYPSPMQASAGQAFTSQASAGLAFTSQPQPGPGMGGHWGPYPYYDYMFITGQYPPGTYTDLSMSNERGYDSWEDAHYRRYYPAQVTSAVPQKFQDPQPAVKTPGKGGAAPGKGRRY